MKFQATFSHIPNDSLGGAYSDGLSRGAFDSALSTWLGTDDTHRSRGVAATDDSGGTRHTDE